MATLAGGIKYPSNEDSNELVRVFGSWLNHRAISDRSTTVKKADGTPFESTERHSFELLLQRLEDNPIYQGLPSKLRRLDEKSHKLDKPTRAERDMDREVVDVMTTVEQTHDKLNDYVYRLRRIDKALLALDSGLIDRERRDAEKLRDELAARRSDVKASQKDLERKLKKEVKKRMKASIKAKMVFGKTSPEFKAASELYKKAEADLESFRDVGHEQMTKALADPMIAFEARHREHLKHLDSLRSYKEKLGRDIDAARSRIDDLNDTIVSIKSQHKKAIEDDVTKRLREFDEAWLDAFMTFCGCMRYDQHLVDMFRDVASINRETFVDDFNRAYQRIYRSNMIKTQSELDMDKVRREDVRAVNKKKGEQLYIPPTTIDSAKLAAIAAKAEKVKAKRGISAEVLIDRLLDAAEATVNTFSDIPMFELRTQVDFARKSANYHVRDSTGKIVANRLLADRRTIPRIGYFQFKLVAVDAYQAYDLFLTRFMPITVGMREMMIDALRELSHAFTEHEKHIISVNEVTKTVMIGDETFHTQEAISIDIMQDTIAVAISQLEKEEPDIDNYVKAYMHENVPGYVGGSLDDLRCEFYNPFNIAPVYYIFGVAGASHKAVDKTHYWLHIVNTQCEDMDCIPSALSIKRPGLVSVPEEQVAAVRAKIVSMSAQELDDSDHAYKSILSDITVPWIIIKNVTQCGTWKVYKCSDPRHAHLSPLEFKLMMNEIVGLLVKQGHVTRIVGFEDYDGAGWFYDLDGFVVTAKVSSDSGVGSSIAKLLRGNEHLIDSGDCCIGDQTYEELKEIAQRHKAVDLLRQLTGRDLIPKLVHDMLDMAESSGMLLGPGEIDGEVYDNVSVNKLIEAECVEQAQAEWDSRACNGISEDSFKVWDMLRLPRWIVVSHINKDDETWVVEDASDDTLLTCTPAQAVSLRLNLFVFVRHYTRFEDKRSTTLHRAIDYFIKLPVDDGSTDQYSGRYNLVVTCNSNGILETIKAHMPKSEGEIDEEKEDLITADELEAAAQLDSIEEQLECFKGIRYAIVNDIKLSDDNRIKYFETVARRGKVKAEEIAEGAHDLLRLWMDPNKQTWLIVDSRWYNIQRCLKGLYDELPVAYIGADYETLNMGSQTIPVLLSWARLNGSSEELTSGCFKGSSCTRSFVNMVAGIVSRERRRVIVVTFHGAFFDMHMLLEGIATWGSFGQHERDRVVVVGNKLLEIDWFEMVKIIDLRRFTQNSLAGICEAFHVKNPKSDIDLKLIQELYERGNCSLDSFWISLRGRSARELVKDIEADRQCPEFQERIMKLDGEQAYIEYCINDSIATVQCYMKVKQACVDSMATVDVPDSMKEELREKYNIDLYCTIPSMAYKCYRAGLPVVDGEKVMPPTAPNITAHKCIKAACIGGRSEVYSFTPPHIIQEHHQVFDVASLFPFGAMAGHMPAGRLRAVSQDGKPVGLVSSCGDDKTLDIEITPLPVPNKQGIYYCTIEQQPEFIVIPNKEAGKPLDWKCRSVFSRWVHVVMIRLHIYLGGSILIHYGYVWDDMCDHYFDNSLRLWKSIKNDQDVLKSKIPTVSDEDSSIDMAKLEAMLEAKDRRVAWALNEVGRDEEAIKAVLDRYNPMVRWLSKMMSNSLLGRTAKKLKEYDTLVLSGSASVQKFIEEHSKDRFVIHKLSKLQDASPSVMTQLIVPYSKCSLVTLELDQNDLFDPIKGRGKDRTKVPEACISVTMYAYTHFHMALSIARFYKARALRGVETDGIHANPAEYVKWCEDNGIENPFWIDSPLLKVEPGSILDDAVFKPTPGDDRSEAEMLRLGSFYCPSAANRYAAEHKQPSLPKTVDYGYFTEEIRDQGLFDVFYPFCKFYYYKCLATGHETFRAKGLSAGKKSPSREGRAYIELEHSSEYRKLSRPAATPAKALKQQLKQMDMIHECLKASSPVVDRSLFEKIGQGIGVDVIDFRFQGRLSKINATQIHTEDLVDGKQDRPTPIRYTLFTKRIEPHRAYRAVYEDGHCFRNDVQVLPEDLELIKERIRAIVKAEDPIGKRGFTLSLGTGPLYVSSHVFRKVLNTLS